MVEDTRQSEPARPATRTTGKPPESPEPARVLVLDDDPQTLRFVRDALTRAGYSVLVTGEHETGNEDLVRNFVKKLRAKLGEDAANPTLIFNMHGVGYRMPRPDGG